jgi:hypothetical protein
MCRYLAECKKCINYKPLSINGSINENNCKNFKVVSICNWKECPDFIRCDPDVYNDKVLCSHFVKVM